MSIDSIKIKSNNMHFGPFPKDGTEIEQELKLDKNGRVYFQAYNYKADYFQPERLVLGRNKQLKIGEKEAKEILGLFEKQFLLNKYENLMVTDMSLWEVEIIDSNNKEYLFVGYMIGKDSLSYDLASFIKKYININKLFLFG